MFNAKSTLKIAAVASVGLLVAFAPDTAAAAAAANNFSSISQNIIDSIASVPGLLSAVAYVFGLILLILGIIKLKEHVEKPDQTPLKEAFIRLLAGGAMFALPLLINVIKESIDAGATTAALGASKVKTVKLSVD